MTEFPTNGIRAPGQEIGFQVKSPSKMATEEKFVHGIEKFDVKDFDFWRIRRMDYLYGKKMHQPLLIDEKPSTMMRRIGNS